MRTLKFRAWVGESKWDYYVYDIQKRADMAEWFGQPNIQIEQYTGLKDKNGKEIYEGDIVDISGERAIVVFDEKLGSYMGSFPSPVDDNARYNDYIFDFDDIIEVIGNVHENSELLGGEEAR